MTTDRKPRTLDDRSTAGELRGYEPGWPPRIGHTLITSSDISEIDSDACSESDCPVCGCPGLHCRPFRRINPDADFPYMPFAVCRGCGHAEPL